MQKYVRTGPVGAATEEYVVPVANTVYVVLGANKEAWLAEVCEILGATVDAAKLWIDHGNVRADHGNVWPDIVIASVDTGDTSAEGAQAQQKPGGQNDVNNTESTHGCSQHKFHPHWLIPIEGKEETTPGDDEAKDDETDDETESDEHDEGKDDETERDDNEDKGDDTESEDPLQHLYRVGTQPGLVWSEMTTARPPSATPLQNLQLTWRLSSDLYPSNNPGKVRTAYREAKCMMESPRLQERFALRVGKEATECIQRVIDRALRDDNLLLKSGKKRNNAAPAVLLVLCIVHTWTPCESQKQKCAATIGKRPKSLGKLRGWGYVAQHSYDLCADEASPDQTHSAPPNKRNFDSAIPTELPQQRPPKRLCFADDTTREVARLLLPCPSALCDCRHLSSCSTRRRHTLRN